MYRRNDEMVKMGLDQKLIYAVATNNIDSIREKLKGITARQLNMKYLSYDSPLLLAASDNNLEATKLLVQAGANLEIKDITGCTPLAIALKKGNEELAFYLIEHGASICHESNRRISTLHYAAVGCGRKMIEYLLDKGLDINYLASDKISALDFTTDIASKGNYEAAETLIKNGIGKEIITKAFKEACWRGNDKIACLLLQSGADINVIMGKNGAAPETLFWLCKMPNRLKRTGYLKTIRLLIGEGLSFESSYNFAGHLIDCIGSPLQRARNEKFNDAIRLIKYGEW